MPHRRNRPNLPAQAASKARSAVGKKRKLPKQASKTARTNRMRGRRR